MADEMKVDSIEDNNSSTIENRQVNNNKRPKWYRNETNKESIDFDQQEPESNENKISCKLSSMTSYSPKIKDYVYTVSKTIRWIAICK